MVSGQTPTCKPFSGRRGGSNCVCFDVMSDLYIQALSQWAGSRLHVLVSIQTSTCIPLCWQGVVESCMSWCQVRHQHASLFPNWQAVHRILHVLVSGQTSACKPFFRQMCGRSLHVLVSCQVFENQALLTAGQVSLTTQLQRNMDHLRHCKSIPADISSQPHPHTC